MGAISAAKHEKVGFQLIKLLHLSYRKVKVSLVVVEWQHFDNGRRLEVEILEAPQYLERIAELLGIVCPETVFVDVV